MTESSSTQPQTEAEYRPEHRRLFFRRTKPGSVPGLVVPDPDAPAPVIRVMAYGPDRTHESRIENPEEIRQYLGQWPVTWVNVDGLGNEQILRKLGEIFGLHNLALEDVVNVHQRAKVEQYGSHLFIVMRMLSDDDSSDTEQMSMFLGKDFVLTFQENAGDCFDPLRERIRQRRGHVRTTGPDYLAYSLIDAVIDSFFPALEYYGDWLEELESQVLLSRPRSDVTEEIHEAKKDLLVIRRAVWPTREAVNALLRENTPMVTENTRIYLRDCYDHTVQILDLLENQRETASDLVDLYISTANAKMNEIMKVLTIITTIFIPLSFITGLYGMNFRSESSQWNMPELDWRYGYPTTLLLMLVVTLGQLIFFRRKGWIGRSRRDDEDDDGR